MTAEKKRQAKFLKQVGDVVGSAIEVAFKEGERNQKIVASLKAEVKQLRDEVCALRSIMTPEQGAGVALALLRKETQGATR